MKLVMTSSKNSTYKRVLLFKSFSSMGHNELECSTFLVSGLKTAAFWTLTDQGIVEMFDVPEWTTKPLL